MRPRRRPAEPHDRDAKPAPSLGQYRARRHSSGALGIGGGIANFNFGIPGAPAPALVLNNSTVTGNAVSEDGLGGGLANPDFFGPGFVTLNHTDISGNTPDNCFPPGTIAGCTG